jgi:hypothetical protein
MNGIVASSERSAIVFWIDFSGKFTWDLTKSNNFNGIGFKLIFIRKRIQRYQF